jgi:hypothetical protein
MDLREVRMGKVWEWVRNGLALAGILALGMWLGSARTVTAAGYQPVRGVPQFQLTGVDPSSALLVYEPESHAVYVYRAVTVGSNVLSCSYKFQLDRPGAPIQRRSCDLP